MTDGTCAWANGSVAMRGYHDREWGVPSHDDRHLFEMLTLEGAQAGLAWSMVLSRREGYRDAFARFDAEAVAHFSDEQLEDIRINGDVIRNRAKVASARSNAVAILQLRENGVTLSDLLWSYVQGETIVNEPRTLGELVATSALSVHISKDLKRRGFSFVGPTIVYALLEAVGIIDDHIVGCPRKGAR